MRKMHWKTNFSSLYLWYNEERIWYYRLQQVREKHWFTTFQVYLWQFCACDENLRINMRTKMSSGTCKLISYTVHMVMTSCDENISVTDNYCLYRLWRSVNTDISSEIDTHIKTRPCQAEEKKKEDVGTLTIESVQKKYSN